MGSKIKIESIKSPININWNKFENIDIPEDFSGVCRIYVEELTGDIEEDIRKIKKLQSIQGLNEISVNSKDFRVAEYFDTVLKALKVKKEFNLLNDYEMKSRGDIDFSHMTYDKVRVPFDYMMRVLNSNVFEYTNHEIKEENCILAGLSDLQRNYQELPRYS